jgi:hypothetical protein
MNKELTRKDKFKFRSILLLITIVFIAAILMVYHLQSDCLIVHESNCDCVLCLETKHGDFCKCDLCSKLDKIDKKHLADCKYVECVVNHQDDCRNANCYCKCPTCSKCELFNTFIVCWSTLAGIFLTWYAIDYIRERKQK